MKVVNRVKKSEEFQEIINTGKYLKIDSFRFYYKTNQLGYARVGISIPTKIGHAVTRNKIRRQIRAILHDELDLSLSMDLILIPRLSYKIEEFSKNKSTIAEFLKKVGEN